MRCLARLLLAAPPAALAEVPAVLGEREAVCQFQLQQRSPALDEELNNRLLATANSSLCKIFTLWDYDHEPELGHLLVVEGWRRHSKGLCNEPVLIDDANVKLYIPDMPDEFFKLPYQQAKSDMVRYGALYHHGGIYMDTDVLVQKDLHHLLGLTKKYDLVSYVQGKPDENSTCQNKFSSNFLAGPKNSTVHKAIWEEQKKLLRNHCPLSDADKEVVCCFDDEDRECHVPWAALGEGVAHAVSEEKQLNALTFCFTGSESFNPGGLGTALHEQMGIDKAEEFLKKSEKDPLDRIAYHLFNSVSGMSQTPCNALKEHQSFLGTLQRQSYTTGGGDEAIPQDRSEHTKTWLQKYPYFKPLSDPAFNGRLPCD